MNLGVLLAFIPFFGWGIGDFLIQKSTRTIGTNKTLFSIGALSTPLLLPFIWKELLSLNLQNHLSLIILSFFVLAYAVILFRAFKVGKLSVVESIVALELPFAVAMATVFLGERLLFVELVLFLIICAGVALASVKKVEHLHYHKHFLERGVWLALAAALLAAIVDLFIGTVAQSISPLLTIWYQHAFLVLACGAWLTLRGEWKSYFQDLKTHPYLIFGQSLFDNIAWIGFAYAVTSISISLTLTISEGYIIVAALLGHFSNHEKLRSHQMLGAGLAIPAVIALAFISG